MSRPKLIADLVEAMSYDIDVMDVWDDDKENLRRGLERADDEELADLKAWYLD